jgi:hypothetical protein
MKRYYQQGYSKFSFRRIVKKTDRATLFEIIPKVQIKHDLIIGPDARFKFFDFISILESAEEVHCVNSSFLHLVDRIKTNGKLFYHSCRNPIDMITLRKNWDRCYQA